MEKLVGKITHYFNKIGVAIVELTDTLRVGDKIKIKGHNKEFEQEVTSLQIDRESVSEAKKGDTVGMKVTEKVKEGDEVYLISE
ncbi:MAG: translation elongation factor-like protein [Candidatus Paceibacterota bacterium]